MKFIISLLLITVCFFSCKTSKLGLDPECREIEKLIVEFASKMEPRGDSCVVFRFDTDTLKYIKYKYRNGRELFYDHRTLENLFWWYKLTEEFKPLSDFDKNCISGISKDKIIKLFGKNYKYNEFYKFVSYEICNGSMVAGISFYLNENDKIKYFSIYLL